jgi:hypothetical protein
MRYPRVGGRRQHCFGGTSLQPRKLPKNAAIPTSRVHAVLGIHKLFQLLGNNKFMNFPHRFPSTIFHV